MNADSSWLVPLRWLLWITAAASVLHYADNLLFFEQYPEPPWINRHLIDTFWWLMTPLAWIGYRLVRHGRFLVGTTTLLAYAACNLLTLGHYRYASMHKISPRIHFFIMLEGVMAAMLIIFLLFTCMKRLAK